KDAKAFGINKNDIIDLLLIVAPFAIIGARLYYVAFEWSNYKNNFLEIFNIRHGGLAIYGGILTAVIVAYAFTKKRKINVLKFFDFLIPYVALAQSIGRWGNFVNQEAHGTETSLPWRMEIFDQSKMQRIAVHPTFLYESLWNLGLFLFLLWFRKRKKHNGEVFTLYLALYGFARFFIEGMRTDSLYIGTLRVSQMLAGLFFIFCITLFFVRRNKLRISEKA
ncbi:MAG TPA: prolipoprotein diacylglyceryl transferase, partial [Clostridia bacterium]